jgi:hypothetical protein
VTRGAAERLEAYLARLYTDEEVRRRFLADPRGEALAAGLDPDDAEAVAAVDPLGLSLAAESTARKRSGRAPGGH